MRARGQPVPAPVAAQALIDIGADVSCVDSKMLAPLVLLGLQPARITLANVPALGGLGASREYYVGLTVLHPSGNPRSHLTIRNLPIIEHDLGTLGYQTLIGRDLLSRCLLVYDGPGGAFTLAF